MSFMLSVTNRPLMLSVVILSVVMLSVVMLSVVMLSVVMLNVVAPHTNHSKEASGLSLGCILELACLICDVGLFNTLTYER